MVIYNPSSSTSIYILDLYGNSAYQKTIGDCMSFCGNDCGIFYHVRDDYYYWLAFNVGNNIDYYVRDDGEDINSFYYGKNKITSSIVRCGCVPGGSLSGLAEVSPSSITIDDIIYNINAGNDTSNHPTMFVYNAQTTKINRLIINGASTQSYTSNGGGATHIAKRTGQLKDLSSYTSDILIVSGGGGGGLLVDTTEYTGKEAGGISGSGDNSADQSTGNAFGLGESGTNESGGGSGLYGGYKGTSSKSGGAGSGYIGNSLLSNKKMVGYNVPTSSATGTKTESVEVFDSNYVANKPKAGNGHCRIKFLRDSN